MVRLKVNLNVSHLLNAAITRPGCGDDEKSEDPKYKKKLDIIREELLKWMKRTNDPALEAFKNRSSTEALKKFMAEQNARAGKRQKKRNNRKKRTS